jgi:hypothetical protein
MSKYSVYTTTKGTELPLMSLKGKPYMQVAHRLVWLTEEVPSYETSTEFLSLSEEMTVAKVTVTIFKDGGVLKKVSATKRETKKDFPDHTEKAETGALGRALALAGYGTQFAIADLDEENRLADSPVATVNKEETKKSPPAPVVAKTAPKVEAAAEPTQEAPAAQEAPKPRFGGFKAKVKKDGE